jgi:hypothetical protein
MLGPGYQFAQVLAEGFAERAANLVDLNDRAYTMRAGGLRSDEDDAGPRGGYQDGQYPSTRGYAAPPVVLCTGCAPPCP